MKVPNETIAKYLNMSRLRAENRVPLGEICEYCASINSRNEKQCCSRCGVGMRAVFGVCFGIPIYDPQDCMELRKVLPIYGMSESANGI